MSLVGALINANKQLIYQAQSLGGNTKLFIPINGFPSEGSVTQVILTSASAFTGITTLSFWNTSCGLGTSFYPSVNNFLASPTFTANSIAANSSGLSNNLMYNFSPAVDVYDSEYVGKLYVVLESTVVLPALNVEVHGYGRLNAPLDGVDRNQQKPEVSSPGRPGGTWWRILWEQGPLASSSPGLGTTLYESTIVAGRGSWSKRSNLTVLTLPTTKQYLNCQIGYSTTIYFGAVSKTTRFYLDLAQDNKYPDATLTLKYWNGAAFVGFSTVYYGTRGSTTALQLCYSGVIHLSPQSDWVAFKFNNDPQTIAENTYRAVAGLGTGYVPNYFLNPPLFWIQASVGLATAGSSLPIVSILPLRDDY